MRIPDSFISPIHELIEDLVAGNYSRLELDGRSGRLTAKQLESAVNNYPGCLVSMPREAVEDDEADFFGPGGLIWSLRINLWTQEERPSDLSLELFMHVAENSVKVEIEELHVM